MHDRQNIGPSWSLALGLGAVSVLVVVPHPSQVPFSRVGGGAGTLLFVTGINLLCPGLGVFHHLRGRFFINALIITHLSSHNNVRGYVNYLDFGFIRWHRQDTHV